MRDLETAKIMLRSAERDLLALGHMLDQNAFPVEVFGFHAQQVVEKSLKAWLSIKGAQFQRTHNIRHLVALLEPVESDVSNLWNLARLTGFAVQFRYEGFEMEDEELDRSSILQMVRDLFVKVEKMMS